MVMYGHWQFDQEFNVEDWFGFIYRITHLPSGREYIGKKQFFSHQRKKVSGRKNRKRVQISNKWEEYTGSSKELNELINSEGKDNFTFEILSLHKSRGGLHYAEVDRQIKENVLKETLDTGERKFFNKCINSVKFIPPTEGSLVRSEETKKRISQGRSGENHYLSKMSDEEREKFLNEHFRGENNPAYEMRFHLKGKTYEERYGQDRAAHIRQKIKNNMTVLSGEDNPMYGKTHTEEAKRKMSESHKGKNTGKDNPMYGRPWYEGRSEEEIQRWKDNLSKAGKGRIMSEEHKKKIGEAHKGRKKTIVTCPHCGRSGGNSNMKRYHFDHCKNKKV